MDGLELIEIEHSDTFETLLEEVGKVRYDVWLEEGAMNAEMFPNKCFLDYLDKEARQWTVRDNGKLIATARLTFHPTLEDGYRDAALWKEVGVPIPLPTCDLGRLVVLVAYRGRGIAQELNKIRIQAAKDMGAKSIIVTASEGNAKLLRKLGFFDIGRIVEFEDRPGIPFHALQLNIYETLS